MKIRDHKSGRRQWQPWGIRIGIALLLLVALYFGWRKYKNRWRESAVVACDMETVEKADDGTFFIANGLRLFNGQTQAEGTARSGSHSCLLFDTQQFGATWQTADIHPGDVLEASIWRKSRDNVGYLIADGSWGLYQEAALSGKQDGEWEELTLRLRVPTYVKEGTFKFYAWNPNAAHVYFDDLSVRHIKAGKQYPAGALNPDDEIVTLDLVVGDKGMSSLHQQRDAAMKAGILSTKEESWVKVKILDGKQELKGRLRLKGDWTDHLLGDKWSYRIELDKENVWRRMTTFSVQNPKTRYFLSEWIFHQWLDKEDILTPRYGFIRIKVNGISKGLYAYEEHFEKQIVEYNSRREGPILKYDEEGLWEAQGISIDNEVPDFETHVPAYKASDVIPFGLKSAMKDSAMMRQVEIAQQLVQQYKTGQKTVWDIFDAPKVARYYAIIDLMSAQHGIIWHNQRWYYNPVISRLEPIGFDGFTEVGPLLWIDKPFIGFSRNIRYMASGYREMMFERFFHDPKFLELYIGALFKFSDPAYLDAFYYQIEPQIQNFEMAMQEEWPGYQFDRKVLFDRAKTIRLLLQPLQRSSVKAHLQGKTGKGYHYRVYNYHCLPVILLGVGDKEDKRDAPFSEEKLLDAYNNEFPAEYLDVYSEEEGKWVFFKVPGIDSTFTVEVMPWEEPNGLTPEQSLFQGLKITSNAIYQVNDSLKRVTFKTGKYKTSQDLLFPPGYQVWFEKGVELDLTGKAKFISKSQVLMFGTQEQPILVTSSDHSANGFTVLQAPGKSEFHYVAFDHLNTLQYKGWNLTGAVTLYESECLFDHARFVNNHCEDALNTIRCIFTYHDSYIGYTQGDGFDSDFCTGTLTNAMFSHTGNDGMDFSGSKIVVNSAIIENAGDKGISMGEECTATIVKATVRNSVIGIAAKDLSKVTVKFIELYDNEQAFAAYQKKP
ncbi:MAG TPA: hypothetical protein VHS96_16150, partial [Bacteroidia bacterium]|nr:hypothetical protein [Bacteroidia bacterium]